MSADKSDADLEVFNNLLPPGQDRSAIDEKRTLLGLQAPLPGVPGNRAGAGVRAPGPPRSGADESVAAALGGPAAAGPRQARGPVEQERVSLDEWATRSPGAEAHRGSSKGGRTSPPKKADRAQAARPSPDDDAGWEDDDDKTTIYGTDGESGTQDLLRPQPVAEAPPPPPMSRPPGGATVPPNPSQRQRPQARQDTAFIPVAPPSSPAWVPYTVATALIALVFLVVFLLVAPSKGSLHVTVTGPGNRAIPGVEVRLNGKLSCSASPCEVPDLTAGTYLVVARAPGYQPTGEIAVDVSGAQSVKNITLARFVGTGIHVLGKGSGLMLSVDGQEVGPLPQAIRDMTPGEHVIQVSGGTRYADFTQRVGVEADRMTTVGPVRLRVVKGLATIVAGPGAEGADATLLVGSTRKVLPKLPIRLEVDTSRSHVLVAKRPGYVPYQQPIVFSDGQAEQTIEVSLVSEAAQAEAPRRLSQAQRKGQNGQAATSATSTLSLISTPPSSVVLDGKPLGSTPQEGLQVEPGAHSVLFIHGSERRHRQVVVASGKQETVAVHF